MSSESGLPGTLNFSKAITLTSGQTMSVVVDRSEGSEDSSTPILSNYGLILQGAITTKKIVEDENNPNGTAPGEGVSDLEVEGLKEVQVDEQYFHLKMCNEELDEKRDFEKAFENHVQEIEVEENGETVTKTVPLKAVDKLSIKCTNRGNPKIFGFTVKIFPHFGVYGYVNYIEGDELEGKIHTGTTLSKVENINKENDNAS